jgi:hypothetical protein
LLEKIGKLEANWLRKPFRIKDDCARIPNWPMTSAREVVAPMLISFWNTWRKHLSSSRPSKSCRRSRRLELERLEDRIVPTSASLLVGPNVDITQASGNEAESTISINPTNPNNLFECDTLSDVGHYSTDGGATWKVSDLSAFPSHAGIGADVQTTWDSFGNLFLTQFGTAARDIVVGRSSDGGATFKDVRTIVTTSSDQPSIAFGPSGAAGIPEAVWISVNTGANNDIVAAGAPVMGFDNVGAFSAPVALTGSSPGDFGSIAVGPDGQVMVNYQNLTTTDGPDTILANLDPDGLGPNPFGSAFAITNTNVGGHAPIPAQPGRTIDAEGNLAWDRSGGPHNGRVYLVYVDRPSTSSDNTNIFVRYSDDNGATWSAPVAVDPIGNGKSQLQPAIAVDQTTGNVAVTWYDTRNSGPANNTTQVFGSVSLDGGATWLPAVQISTGTSNASAVDESPPSPFDYGDYDLMDFSHNVFYRSWADNSNSTGNNPDGTGALDIYTAEVRVETISVVLTSATEGVPLNNVPVATFFDDSGVPLTSYSATLDWGDGTVTSGQVIATSTPNVFDILGSHTYLEEGNYTLTVSVNNGKATIGPASGIVTVADAPLSGFSQAITGSTGSFVNNALVAVFSDSDSNLELPSNYTASIQWFEGNGLSFSSTGTISNLFNNTFAVDGSTPFSFPGGGLFTVRVVIQDVGGASVTVDSVINVANKPAIPLLFVPQSLTDTGPVTVQFVSMEDALTNLLSAERLFFIAFNFGTTREKQGAFGNLVNAFFAYEAAITAYDLQLPGA